jgi:hypothetical protein
MVDDQNGATLDRHQQKNADQTEDEVFVDLGEFVHARKCDQGERYPTGIRPRCRARSNQVSICANFVAAGFWRERQPS